MTRDEEIQIAAEEYANGSPNATLRHKAFIDGAEYAVEYADALLQKLGINYEKK